MTKLYEISTFVTGARFRPCWKNGDMNESSIRVGDELKLIHEIGNKFDPLALMVLTEDDIHVGYIPQVTNPQLHDAVSRGHRLVTTVNEYNFEKKRILINVTVFKPAKPTSADDA